MKYGNASWPLFGLCALQMNISHDAWIRTTDEGHEQLVCSFLQRVKDRGDIYKDTYEVPPPLSLAVSHRHDVPACSRRSTRKPACIFSTGSWAL